MSRVQLLRARNVLGAAVAEVALTLIKKGNDITVTAAVSKGGMDGVMVDICDDSGKIRVFKDVDDFIKSAAKLNLISSAVDIKYTVTNQVVLEPAVFTGDQVKKAQATVANYAANIVALTATSVAQAAGLAVMPSVTPGEIAYKAEKQAQKDAVDAQKAFLDAEIVRINALIGVV